MQSAHGAPGRVCFAGGEWSAETFHEDEVAFAAIGRTLERLDGKSLESGNTLFIRNTNYVAERLRESPQFAILGKQV